MYFFTPKKEVKDILSKKQLTPIKAIRTKCLECSGRSYKEARLCVIPDCPLYPYRMGKNPNRKKQPQKQINLQETK